MAESLRAQAAAVIRMTRDRNPAGSSAADSPFVKTRDLTFTVSDEDVKWLKESAARTRRAMNPDEPPGV